MLKINRSIRSKRLAEKRRNQAVRTIVIYGVLIIAILISLITILRNPFFAIEQVNVKGNMVIDTNEIGNLVREKISGKYLGILPRSNVFLYPKKDIKQTLLKTFPRISKLEIKSANFNGIMVSIGEYLPFALWCGEEPSSSESVENCFFLDSSGYIFSEAPNFSDDVYMKYYGKVSGDGIIGSVYLNRSTFVSLSKFVAEMGNIDAPVVRVFAKDDGDFSAELSFGGEILFSTKIPLEKTLDNLHSFLGDKSIFENGAASLALIHHIDLRADSKIFYQFIK